MSRGRPPYDPEIRRKIVQMVHAGRGPEELAKYFEPSAQTIRNWVKQEEQERQGKAVRSGA